MFKSRASLQRIFIISMSGYGYGVVLKLNQEESGARGGILEGITTLWIRVKMRSYMNMCENAEGTVLCLESMRDYLFSYYKLHSGGQNKNGQADSLQCKSPKASFINRQGSSVKAMVYC